MELKFLRRYFYRRQSDNDTIPRVAVIGLGVFGRSVCRVLFEGGAEVLAIDLDRDLVNQAKEFSTDSVMLDVTNEKALKKFRLFEYDTVIVAIGERYQDSFLVTAHLKEIGVKYVIARATTTINRRILEKIGADEIIAPEETIGENLGHRLVEHRVYHALAVNRDYALVEIEVPPFLAGHEDAAALLEREYNLRLLLVRKAAATGGIAASDGIDAAGDTDAAGGGYKMATPGLRLEEGQLITLLGSNESVHRFVNDGQL